jgi:hypothetical protein
MVKARKRRRADDCQPRNAYGATETLPVAAPAFTKQSVEEYEPDVFDWPQAERKARRAEF